MSDAAQLLSQLDDVLTTCRTMFGRAHDGAHTARLAQLEGSLATAKMAISHLHDEHEREADLRKRVAEGGRDMEDKHGHQIHGWSR